jgi:hypothetical protein
VYSQVRDDTWHYWDWQIKVQVHTKKITHCPNETSQENIITFRTLYNLRESLGRPRTVLCHTTGKLVRLQKFWVTAIVKSRLSTTCHQPPGTNTVSPGFCTISNCKTWIQVTLLHSMVKLWFTQFTIIFTEDIIIKWYSAHTLFSFIYVNFNLWK